MLFDNKADIEEFLNLINSKYPIQEGNTTTSFCNVKDIKQRKDGKYFCPAPRENLIDSKFKSKYIKEKYNDNWVDTKIEIFQNI